MARKILLAAMLAATLSAGAISARQLKTSTNAIVACGSTCTTGDTCKRLAGVVSGSVEALLAPASQSALRLRGQNKKQVLGSWYLAANL
jgi:hypothetical protein